MNPGLRGTQRWRATCLSNRLPVPVIELPRLSAPVCGVRGSAAGETPQLYGTFTFYDDTPGGLCALALG